MIINERDNRRERLLDVAGKMMTAARTAPKAKGVDIIECCVVEGDDIRRISEVMKVIYAETGRPVYQRDSDNILSAECMLVIATRNMPLGLNCAHCGFPTCDDKPAKAPCAVNCTDVGIAIGSAVATAADHRVDCRVIFSAGMACERLNLLDGCGQYYCIPMSCSSKNPFFDRK